MTLSSVLKYGCSLGIMLCLIQIVSGLLVTLFDITSPTHIISLVIIIGTLVGTVTIWPYHTNRIKEERAAWASMALSSLKERRRLGLLTPEERKLEAWIDKELDGLNLEIPNGR